MHYQHRLIIGPDSLLERVATRFVPILYNICHYIPPRAAPLMTSPASRKERFNLCTQLSDALSPSLSLSSRIYRIRSSYVTNAKLVLLVKAAHVRASPSFPRLECDLLLHKTYHCYHREYLSESEVLLTFRLPSGVGRSFHKLYFFK